MLSYEEFEKARELGDWDQIFNPLPQYQFLSPKRIGWLQSLRQGKFKTPYEYYICLDGLYSPEAIHCLQAFMGDQGYVFKHLAAMNPFDIYRLKTLDIALPEITPVMERESILKGGVKAHFLRQFGAEDVWEVMDGLKTPQAYPWLKASPDLLARVGEELWVVLIKIAPGIKQVSLADIARIHHDLNYLVMNDAEPDKLVVANYDIISGEFFSNEVRKDQVLMQDLLIGGNILWGSILTGKIPKFNVTTTDPASFMLERYIERTGNLPYDTDKFDALIAQARHKAQERNSIEQDLRDIEDEISSMINEYEIVTAGEGYRVEAAPLEERVAEMVGTGILSTEVYSPVFLDIQSIIDQARAVGLDLSPLMSGTQINMEILFQEMNKKGLDLQRVCKSRIIFNRQ